MFKPTEGVQPEIFKKEAINTEKNYVIKKNDLLDLDIYSNNGERLIDPNPDMSGSFSQKTSSNTSSQKESNERTSYLVDLAGLVKLPLIGEMKLEGLTLRQAEEVIQKEYGKFFKEPFVKMSYVNKRVVILGAPGGQVLPLNNQNVSLAEVLAMAKGINNDGKANKIKLIRDEHVYLIDFSTIQGFKDGNMIVEPGDIVYVEPVRRALTEAIRDNYVFIYPLLTLMTIILANKIK